MCFLVAVLCNVTAVALAYAQERPIAAPDTPWYVALWQMALVSLVPALWAAIGPLATAAITKAVNTFAHAYVPRPVQVILSACVAAIGAGLVGDPAGLVEAALEGGTGQVLAATRPHTLLTDERA
jgi:hypothetical protein